jgi:positive regulator of sigma E activity
VPVTGGVEVHAMIFIPLILLFLVGKVLLRFLPKRLAIVVFVILLLPVLGFILNARNEVRAAHQRNAAAHAAESRHQ